MAMRQRFGGVSAGTRPRQPYRSIYEDFQPQFELKEEHEAHIIHVHLPGFVREQVRITFVHSPGVIRVHGQRPLDNNKWSRFNQTFPVQENCDTSKIHAKFNNGILTMTIPKQVITQIGPKQAVAKPIQETPPTPSKTATVAAEAKPPKVQQNLISSKDKESLTTTVAQKQKVVTSLTTIVGPQKTSSSEPKAQKGQEGSSQTTTAAAQDEKQRDKKSDAPPSAHPKEAAAAEPKEQKDTFTARDEKQKDDKNGGHSLALPKGIAETKAQKDKDEALPKVILEIHNEKQRVEKRVVPLTSPERGISEPKSQMGQEEIHPKRLINEKKAEFAVESVDRKDRGEANGKGAETKNAEKVVGTTLHKDRETDERSKEAKAVAKILDKAKKKSKKFGSVVDQGKPNEEDSIAANMMAAAKQGMKSLGKRINGEEKQMLINMGVAVLVLLALGASASYRFWSSGKSKN